MGISIPNRVHIYIYISIIHPRCIREVFSDALTSSPISGYFCIISAPTVIPAWRWKSQATSVIATCYIYIYRYCYMDALHGRWLNGWRKSLMTTTQECCKQFWTSPGGNTPQSSHQLPIMKTIKVRRTRHVGHCWRCRDELISDVLPWIPSHGQARAERPARTYI